MVISTCTELRTIDLSRPITESLALPPSCTLSVQRKDNSHIISNSFKIYFHLSILYALSLFMYPAFTSLILPANWLSPVCYCLLECISWNVSVYSLGYKVSYVLPLLLLPLQSCPTLCDPIDGSPPGSSVHGILHIYIEIGLLLLCLHCSCKSFPIFFSALSNRL